MEVGELPKVYEEVFCGAGYHHGQRYEFYERVNGRPPRKGSERGQIVAYTYQGHVKVRVPFDQLPTEELQDQFIRLTGKTASQLGLVVRRGCRR